MASGRKASKRGRRGGRAKKAKRDKAENVESRPTRSKRGIVAEETSQICFRVAKDKHKALKFYCLDNGLEIGEALESALDSILDKAGQRQ